jgi:hypothetical protein
MSRNDCPVRDKCARLGGLCQCAEYEARTGRDEAPQLTPEARQLVSERVTRPGAAGAQRVLLEVRSCERCRQPVIYWDGDFRHLAARCQDWRGGQP